MDVRLQQQFYLMFNGLERNLNPMTEKKMATNAGDLMRVQLFNDYFKNLLIYEALRAYPKSSINSAVFELYWRQAYLAWISTWMVYPPSDYRQLLTLATGQYYARLALLKAEVKLICDGDFAFAPPPEAVAQGELLPDELQYPLPGSTYSVGESIQRPWRWMQTRSQAAGVDSPIQLPNFLNPSWPLPAEIYHKVIQALNIRLSLRDPVLPVFDYHPILSTSLKFKPSAATVISTSAKYVNALRNLDLQNCIGRLSARLSETSVLPERFKRPVVSTVVKPFQPLSPVARQAKPLGRLAQLEATIRSFPGVSDAAVVKVPGSREVHAYIVASREREDLMHQLRSYLLAQATLPILPSRIIRMDLFPRLADGSLDRKRLGCAYSTRGCIDEATKVRPRDPIEKSLGGVWKSLLGVDNIGVHESFFDLGGYSLTAIRLHDRLKQIFSISLPIKAIFQYPTISLLATYIKRVIQ